MEESNFQITSAPVPLPIFNGMIYDFEAHYSKQPHSGNEINTNIVNLIEPAVITNLPNLKTQLQIGSLSPSLDQGIALVYIIESNKLGYLITKATAQNDQVNGLQPFVDLSGSYYLKLVGSTLSKHSFSGANFESVIRNMGESTYGQGMEVFLANGNSAPVSSLSEHPKLCYHDNTNLLAFLNDNQGLANENDLELFLFSGAVLIENGADSYKAHTPIIVFSDKLNPGQLYLNRRVNANAIYYQQALDVGVLCPPDC